MFAVLGILAAHLLRRYLFLFAKQIDDAVAGDAEQPAACAFDGIGQAIGLDELLQHVLEYVLRVRWITHARTDEIAEPTPLLHDDGSEVLVPPGHHARPSIGFIEWKTFQAAGYCPAGEERGSGERDEPAGHRLPIDP